MSDAESEELAGRWPDQPIATREGSGVGINGTENRVLANGGQSMLHA